MMNNSLPKKAYICRCLYLPANKIKCYITTRSTTGDGVGLAPSGGSLAKSALNSPGPTQSMRGERGNSYYISKQSERCFHIMYHRKQPDSPYRSDFLLSNAMFYYLVMIAFCNKPLGCDDLFKVLINKILVLNLYFSKTSEIYHGPRGVITDHRKAWSVLSNAPHWLPELIIVRCCIRG